MTIEVEENIADELPLPVPDIAGAVQLRCIGCVGPTRRRTGDSAFDCG